MCGVGYRLRQTPRGEQRIDRAIGGEQRQQPTEPHRCENICGRHPQYYAIETGKFSALMSVCVSPSSSANVTFACSILEVNT